MKKSIILFVVGGFFVVCSFPLFVEGSIGAGVCGIVIAGVCAFLGYRAKKKPATAPVHAESDFPFNVKYDGATIEVSSGEPEAQAVNHDDEAAAAIVFDILKERGIDTSLLTTDPATDYLKVITADAYKLCFCRLKLSGQSRYIELTISAKDAKALSDDPRFEGIVLAKKRFTRIPVSGIADITKYADVIHLAYVWGTTTA